MKKILFKILKIAWIVFGSLLILALILVFIKTNTFRGDGIAGIGGAIGLAALLAVMLVAVSFYGGITALFFIIRWIVRKIKKKKEKKNGQRKNFTGRKNRKTG